MSLPPSFAPSSGWCPKFPALTQLIRELTFGIQAADRQEDKLADDVDKDFMAELAGLARRKLYAEYLLPVCSLLLTGEKPLKTPEDLAKHNAIARRLPA